jgi:hypothetical protein
MLKNSFLVIDFTFSENWLTIIELCVKIDNNLTQSEIDYEFLLLSTTATNSTATTIAVVRSCLFV